jgi:hypothetical protein
MLYADSYACDNIEDSELAASHAQRAAEQSYIVLRLETGFERLIEEEGESEVEERTGTLSNTRLATRCRFEDDNMPLQQPQVAKEAAGSKKRTWEYDPRQALHIDSDIMFDFRHNLCFTYLFNKGKYLRSALNKAPALINLLRREKPKGIILPSIRRFMEKKISLHKLSKLFTKVAGVCKTAQTKGLAQTQQCPSHEVKRVNAICPLSERSFYQAGAAKTTIYLSKSAETTTNIKVPHMHNGPRKTVLLQARWSFPNGSSCRMCLCPSSTTKPSAPKRASTWCRLCWNIIVPYLRSI